MSVFPLAKWADLISVSDGDCWLWTGYKQKGYGRIAGRSAHRVTYELLVGPIPVGLEIDHLCRTPLCVNPAHLEPVTRLENMRRHYATQIECVNGHAYDESNTYIGPAGHRDCRACIRRRVAAYKARKRA